MSSPISGLGLAPFGTSLLGFGANAVADYSGKDTLLTDTRQQGTCRRLNPASLSYDFDTSGNMLGMSTAQQLVELALTDSRSFAIRQKVITPSLALDIETNIRSALADLTDGGLIELIQVKASLSGTRLLVNVRWIDKANDTEQLTNL
jgi:hypothetical protein